VPITPDPKITLSHITAYLSHSLDRFRGDLISSGGQSSKVIREELLVHIGELDRRCYKPQEEVQFRELRIVCFEWADVLLNELGVEQPANDRGACLDGLAAILECAALTSDALKHAPPSHEAAFTNLAVRVMRFVMDKLGAKGVFHNTLLFSGRFLVS
jgi:hypothetical protein